MIKRKMKLLIVEDEKNLGETLRDYLMTKNFETKLAVNLQEAKNIFADFNPQLMILDVGLPDGSGLELAKEVRARKKDCIILFCTALNDPQLRLESLEIGAHDFMTKPFELKELILRLERILKIYTTHENDPDEITFGDLIFYRRRFELKDAFGENIPLSQKECAILEYLLRHKNEVVSRDQMIEDIWGENSFPSNRTIDNYIVKLRKWTETDKNHPLTITTVRGIGYKLEA